MTTTSITHRLAAAVALREQGQDHQALELLLALHDEAPDDPAINLQCAWIHDKLGLEAEAVPFYEIALGGDLDPEQRRDALLGLGSTYRTLGRYRESLATLETGVAEFPDHNGMRVFLAMALYNNARHKEACESLLALLGATTGDETISAYRRAIATYADDLDRTWT